MRARVYVNLKRSVLDPQGQAVANALRALGHKEVGEVRQGKFFEVDLSGTDRKACEVQLETMTKELLANPVIEEFKIDWVDGA